jgi:hypothetical protein
MRSYSRFCRPEGLPSSVSPPRQGWQLLACRVLPDLTVAAAARPNRRLAPLGPAHSPCSRSHAHPAGHVATAAGGLLPHRFAPYRRQGAGGNLFCCGCSQAQLTPACPHLLFRGATAPLPGLGVGKFLWTALAIQRRLPHRRGDYTMTAAVCQSLLHIRRRHSTMGRLCFLGRFWCV